MHTELGHRLRQDFLEDLALSQRITLEEWERRPMKERVLALLGSVLERQE
jgi:hypothetical protein